MDRINFRLHNWRFKLKNLLKVLGCFVFSPFTNFIQKWKKWFKNAKNFLGTNERERHGRMWQRAYRVNLQRDRTTLLLIKLSFHCFIYLFIYSFIYLLIYLFIYLFLYLCLYLFLYFFISLFLYIFISLFLYFFIIYIFIYLIPAQTGNRILYMWHYFLLKVSVVNWPSWR